MNTDQAKKIELLGLMSKLGFEPVRKERGGRELKYLSPFRAEEEPSFNLNLDRNCFYDFGECEGGNTLDFAICYLRARGQGSSVSDALSFLDDVIGGLSQSDKRIGDLLKTKISNGEKIEPSLEFVKAMPLTSKRVLDYLDDQRSIPQQIAKKYLSLVQYHNKEKPRKDGRPYFAFGMKNLSKAWEIRSASDEMVFKSDLIKRDISVIQGEQRRGLVNVFEGMLDFRSGLMISGTGIKEPAHDNIIMHSLSSFERTTDYIHSHGYSQIRLFLDNDNAGSKCTDKFKEAFGEKFLI